MKITVCGSIAFIDEMEEAKNQLESMGHQVEIPPLEVVDESGGSIPAKEYYKLRKNAADSEKWIWDRKEWAMRRHFDKVMWSDVILVLNHNKNDISGYIGANTLLEMGLAFHHKKKIYLLNPIPELSYREEILGMRPIVIDTNLRLITGKSL